MSGLIVLVPYSGGQDFYGEPNTYLYDSDEDEIDENGQDGDEEEFDKNDEDGDENKIAYLPIYVATEDEDLALMAVAYNACVSCNYVAQPSTRETEEAWQWRNYPGTLESPGVELPFTEEAYIIPEPGDCFCCGSLDDYLVLSLDAMAEDLQESPGDFVLKSSPFFDSKSIQEEFNYWIEKYIVSLPKFLSKEEDKPEDLIICKNRIVALPAGWQG
uniref:Uncharacterized protein n=1 Tax=Cyanothece sp. (strain PCC 7425 / ATCC 29141) TaxID=395961 RepID=B8HYX2_CYAP4